MEVHLSAELEKQLNDVAAKTGRDAGELAQDVIAGYLAAAMWVATLLVLDRWRENRRRLADRRR